jgi:hypothetical protein
VVVADVDVDVVTLDQDVVYKVACVFMFVMIGANATQIHASGWWKEFTVISKRKPIG